MAQHAGDTGEPVVASDLQSRDQHRLARHYIIKHREATTIGLASHLVVALWE